MSADWDTWLARWSGAGLIDADTAARITAYEQERARSGRLQGPVVIALAFGALAISGGILLFVAANWSLLSPAQRYALVLLLVGGLHGLGALASGGFPTMATALHAAGTVALGAGIALGGQIFHLDEHWPGGLMLWAIGAAAAWLLLRQAPQLFFAAALVPAWLTAEWTVALGGHLGTTAARVLATGWLLTALAYFTAPHGTNPDSTRRTLMWLGGLALPVAASAVVVASLDESSGPAQAPTSVALIVGAAAAVGLPLGLGYMLHGTRAWPLAAAAAWAFVLFALEAAAGSVALYGWWALGAIGLVTWGLRDASPERINMGAAAFAATVGAFYFSEVMDKLGRSASLVGLGLLFLTGGWALERVRRRLISRTRGTA